MSQSHPATSWSTTSFRPTSAPHTSFVTSPTHSPSCNTFLLRLSFTLMLAFISFRILKPLLCMTLFIFKPRTAFTLTAFQLFPEGSRFTCFCFCKIRLTRGILWVVFLSFGFLIPVFVFLFRVGWSFQWWFSFVGIFRAGSFWVRLSWTNFILLRSFWGWRVWTPFIFWVVPFRVVSYFRVLGPVVRLRTWDFLRILWVFYCLPKGVCCFSFIYQEGLIFIWAFVRLLVLFVFWISLWITFPGPSVV